MVERSCADAGCRATHTPITIHKAAERDIRSIRPVRGNAICEKNRFMSYLTSTTGMVLETEPDRSRADTRMM